jgi:hypothetical protein
MQECEETCETGDVGISGATNLLKTFTRNTNKAMSEIWTWIFFAYGGWQFDDGNQTDLPSASDTLSSGQTNYALPTGNHGIRGIEVKDTGGVWHPLSPIKEEQIRDMGWAMSEFMKTSGQPLYYQLVGESARIFPPANYTQSLSFRVFFDRGMTAFASSDTTKTPGFPSTFHDAVPCGASLYWLRIHKPNSNVTRAKEVEWVKWEKTIKKYYQRKFEELNPGRFTIRDATREFV